jgi:deoxyribodipyrimidine photo-lyase
MSSRYRCAIYLFNRDLRVQDNELLTRATRECQAIYPIFVFTSEQIRDNRYINARSIQFMARTLDKLACTIPLAFFHGKTEVVVVRLIRDLKADALYNNMDVSPFARHRSKLLADICKDLGIVFVQGRDVFMIRDVVLTKSDGLPYLKFTPFAKNAEKYVKNSKAFVRPRMDLFKKMTNTSGDSVMRELVNMAENSGFSHEMFAAGRVAAVRALKKFAKSGINYEAHRDILSEDATSHISAYLHLGVLGPNEVARALTGSRNRAAIVRQLLWREFYLYIVWKHHTDYSKASISIVANNKIRWNGDRAHLKHWMSGTTGCPIVDAGMREMNATGFMHNRARMIVAMYLIYYLRLDWRLGETYFARTLTDYDYCNNLGGWMWCAGWEVYSNDWFRPFSVISQAERFDPDAKYMKKWIPELKDIEPRDLWDWSENYKKYPDVKYSRPIVTDLNEARRLGFEMYKRAHRS